MASLAEIQALVQQIKNDLPLLINRSQITPQQVVIVEGLSDISERLGLIQAGEFRTGNGKETGFGFTGVRMGYPAFAYASDTWHLAGVSNDVLQFGLSATTGKAYFAAGQVILDSTAMILQAQNNHSYFMLWKTTDDASIVGKIGAYYVSPDSGIEVVGRTKTGYTPVAHLMTENASGTFLTGVEVRGDGEIQIDLRAATVDTAGSQKVRMMTNVNVTNAANTVLYLESGSKGTVAAGFGSAMAFIAENASGNDKTTGYLFNSYVSPTNGAEKTKVTLGYLNNGSLEEIELTCWNGWGIAHEVWTRTGDHQFTVPGDLTTKYFKGVRVRYKESGGAYEYGVISTSSHSAGTTTVSLIPNTDYAMAADPDAGSKYISYLSAPVGFPEAFNYTATCQPSSGSITSVTQEVGYWKPVGTRGIQVVTAHYITNNGTGAGRIIIGMPVYATYFALGYGRENLTTGNMLQSIMGAGGGAIDVVTYNNLYPGGTNYQVTNSIIYQY
jgi:hypothetical protein